MKITTAQILKLDPVAAKAAGQSKLDRLTVPPEVAARVNARAFTVDVENLVTMNSRLHWGKARAHKASQRKQAWAKAWGMKKTFRVRMTYFGGGAGKQLDDDNLRSGMKAIRDGIAEAAGIDDGDPRWDWSDVRQERSPSAWRGVLVEFLEDEQ